MLVFRCLRPFPFTVLMLAILIGVAIWTRTHTGAIAPSIRRSLGFSPLHLARGEWTRLLSCVFFTVGGVKFYASAVMLAIGVGAAERLYGTKQAFALFWGIHLGTLLIASLLVAIPLHAMDVYRGSVLASARDVGPSAGYYGCLGSACAAIPTRWRVVVIASILTIFAIRLVWSLVTIPDNGRAMSADLAHMIAFPIGLFAVRLFHNNVL